MEKKNEAQQINNKLESLINDCYSLDSLPLPTLLTQEKVVYNGHEIEDEIFLLD